MNKQISTYDMMIIGAGAAGLFAAVMAAKSGRNVLLIEHSDTPGKKLLSTGNGRCNFTNRKQEITCYHCADPAFVAAVINAFDDGDVIRFFESIGVFSRETGGYVYPRSNRADSVRNALLYAAALYNVCIKTSVSIVTLSKKNGMFFLDSDQGSFTSLYCLLSTGGMAAPHTGSDGSGYAYAKAFGHTIRRPYPSLMPLYHTDSLLDQAAGVRTAAKVMLQIDSRLCAQDAGEIQLTDKTLSGIPVFQISYAVPPALEDGCCVSVVIDFMPETDEEKLRALLAKRFFEVRSCKPVCLPVQIRQKTKPARGHKKTNKPLPVSDVSRILEGLFGQKLASVFAEKCDAGTKRLADLTDAEVHACVQSLAAMIKAYPVRITGYAPFSKAQTTSGGIQVAEINASTMESEKTPGLYFAGEIMDTDGICGGYNLQWAFSTAAISVRSVNNHFSQ